MSAESPAGMRAPGSGLTIVLPLKDRAPYTRRWMEYANAGAFPFKVLIADGGSDDSAQALLADKRQFPNVDYEYVRYPEDKGYLDFYAKMADAMRRVQTPYVALVDNDDFLVVDGASKAIEFLASNGDYVSCGGQGAALWVVPGVGKEGGDCLYGERVEWKCTREPDSLTGEIAAERLRASARSAADVFYYDVTRTEVARRIFDMVRDMRLMDLFLVESLVRHLVPIAGKVKRLNCLYLVRQRNAPGSSGVAHRDLYGDWFGRMLVPTWSADFSRFLDVISRALAEADGITLESARTTTIESYRAWVVPALLSDLLDDESVSPSMAGVMPVVRRLVQLSADSRLRRFARSLYRRMPWISVNSVSGMELFSRPVANGFRDFKPILDFLVRTR